MSIVDKLAPKTSCGFDGISTKTIKTIKAALFKPNTLLINQMLTTGIFPDKLMIAKMISLHKKHQETLFNKLLTNFTSACNIQSIRKSNFQTTL